MKRKIGKKIISVLMSTALVVSGVCLQGGDASAAKKVTKVTLNKKRATLYVGATSAYSKLKLKATVKAKKAAKVKFKTSNKKIATVSSKGVVKAKKAGKATITATVGKKKATCKITVKKISKKVKKVAISKSKVTIKVGKTYKVRAKVAPKNATLKKLTYTTSKKSVATVSASGVIKGIKAGTAKITARAADGSKKKDVLIVKVEGNKPAPTKAPIAVPTVAPTAVPTVAPTAVPTVAPTAVPTVAPTVAPTAVPTEAPTEAPTVAPTVAPTEAPTVAPTVAPTAEVVKPVISTDGKTATYTLSTEKSYQVSYKDGKTHDVTANDIETVMSYADKYISKLMTSDGKIETGYGKFVNKLDSASDKSVTVKLDKGSATVKYDGKSGNEDKFTVTISESQVETLNATYSMTITKTEANDTVKYVVSATTANAEKVFTATAEQKEVNKVTICNVKFTSAGVVKFAVDSVKAERIVSADGKEVTLKITDASNVVINARGKEKKFNVSKATITLSNEAGNINVKVSDVVSDNATVDGKEATISYKGDTVVVTVPNTARINDITIIVPAQSEAN